jgi:hypothetical protein
VRFKWLREPLLHFLLLGALIFLAYEALSGNDSSPDEIFISRGQQENLLNTFTRTWQRSPTPAEFQGLLQDYLRQEVAYRESRKMGLDQDDIVVRRRLRQKLELLAEDVVSLAPPTEAQLQEYLDERPGDFTFPSRYSLRQIYFSPDRRENAQADATAVLNRLRNGEMEPDTDPMGDALPLPEVVADASEDELSRLFGTAFAQGLQAIEPGGWAGPVESGYGLHLVFVEQRVPPRQPALDEVRESVQREWLNTRQKQSIDALYDKLASRYTIEIEPLVDGDGASE